MCPGWREQPVLPLQCFIKLRILIYSNGPEKEKEKKRKEIGLVRYYYIKEQANTGQINLANEILKTFMDRQWHSSIEGQRIRL